MLLKLIPMPSNFNIQKWISIQILPSLSLVNYEKYTWLILIWRRKGIFYTTEHNVTCLDMPPYVTITPPCASCRSTSVPLRPLTQFSAKRGEGRAFTISLFLKFHQKEILILYQTVLIPFINMLAKWQKWKMATLLYFPILLANVVSEWLTSVLPQSPPLWLPRLSSSLSAYQCWAGHAPHW